jgi:iron complex transport system permease protein
MKRRPLLSYALILVALATMMLAAMCVGRFAVSIADVFRTIFGALLGSAPDLPVNVQTVVLQVRAPRVAAALLVGAALAGAGSAYQCMFRNPLVSPDILGVSSGAALGAVAGIFFSQSVIAIQLFAFAGGLVAVAAVFAVGSALRGYDNTLTLILTGVVIGTLLGSGIALIKYLADPYNQLPAITFWLLGSLASIAPADVKLVAPLALLGVLPLWLLRSRINLLSLPDDEARSLGVNVTAMRIVVAVAATLVTAASVAVSGIIGWIGLLVPHMARMLVGPDFARLLPMALLIGAGYLLGVDTLARTMAQIEVPPGVLTALIGTPFFIWLLAVARRGWT